jgi:hypothetical protein
MYDPTVLGIMRQNETNSIGRQSGGQPHATLRAPQPSLIGRNVLTRFWPVHRPHQIRSVKPSTQLEKCFRDRSESKVTIPLLQIPRDMLNPCLLASSPSRSRPSPAPVINRLLLEICSLFPFPQVLALLD